MASQQSFAAYLERVLPVLVQTGARGAILWCFADYAPSLYRSYRRGYVVFDSMPEQCPAVGPTEARTSLRLGQR